MSLPEEGIPYRRCVKEQSGAAHALDRSCDKRCSGVEDRCSTHRTERRDRKIAPEPHEHQ
jgi:hypothetical protein